MAASVAQAQPRRTEAPAPVTTITAADVEKDKSAEVEELVVVGSRLRRDQYNSPAPVQVITRDESTAAGFASAAEVLQGTAVTTGSAQINNAFGNFVTNGGPGANTLGLRGLGARRTLILLNGRRLSPAGARGAVASADLNVLPNVMIDRIEILKDGASSIYGSDAVAGVVNLITRKNVEGVEGEVDYHYADKDAGSSYRASIAAGATIDRLTINGSLDYYHRTELNLGDRDWTRCNMDYRFNKSTGVTTDFIDPATGQPKCYPLTFGSSAGSNGVTINTLGTSSQPGVPAAGGSGTSFVRWRPNPAITTGLIGFEGVGPNINVRDTTEPRNLLQSLISPVTNYVGFTQATYDLQALGDAQVYFEFLGAIRDSKQIGYKQLSLDYPQGSPLLSGQLATIAPFAGPTPPVITKGKNLQVRAFIGFGNYVSDQNNKYYKPTLGIRGDIPFLQDSWLKDWRYDLNASSAESHAAYGIGTFLTSRLSESLDVVDLGGGNFICRLTQTSPDAGCAPAPKLSAAVIGGQLPQNFVDYVFVQRYGKTNYWEKVVTANFDGPLFSLPAGQIQAALGFEYRWAEISDIPNPDSQADDFTNLTSAKITQGKDNVREVYGEIEIPILKDQPFAKDLTLNFSGRWTDYDSYGADTTYKVTGLYRPLEWLTFRATHGTSYRAPALFEQFQGASTGFLQAASDPCNPDKIGGNAVVAANCASEGLPAGFTGVGNTATTGITVITAGNGVNLSAETSKNTTLGVVLRPPLPAVVGNLQLAVDFIDIRVENEISQIGASNIIDLCYTDPQFRAGGGFCNLVGARNSSSKAFSVLNGYVNIATQTVRGLDYNLRYTRDLGPGSVRVNALVTQYLEQNTKTFPDDPFDEFNGSLNNPEFVGTLDATYSWKKWNFRYGMDWISDMESYTLFGIANPAADTRIMDVPDYYLHHFSVQYSDTERNWQATLGVRNMFDEEPPKISATGSALYPRVGNSPLYSGYDYVGRTFFFNITKKLR
jgi:outer membrane receptor protein involved in Fe transport